MICNFLIFDNLGSRYDPYMGYSGLHRRILLCQFFKKWKNLPKVHVLWPILFQILYWSFFCSPFWSNQVPPTQKNSKNCRKFGKNRFGLNSIFSRLGPKSKKPHDRNFRLFFVILKRHSAWFYLLWGFQKSAHCVFQYFDINVRGRWSTFFSPNFLDVFLNVESDKKNR